MQDFTCSSACLVFLQGERFGLQDAILASRVLKQARPAMKSVHIVKCMSAWVQDTHALLLRAKTLGPIADGDASGFCICEVALDYFFV